MMSVKILKVALLFTAPFMFASVSHASPDTEEKERQEFVMFEAEKVFEELNQADNSEKRAVIYTMLEEPGQELPSCYPFQYC